MRSLLATLSLLAILTAPSVLPARAAIPTSLPEPVRAPDQLHDSADAEAPAKDDEADEEQVFDVMNVTRPRHFGIGFTVLTALGYGPVIRGRYGAIGLEVAPTLGIDYLFNRGDTPCNPVVFEFPLRLTVSALGWFHENELLAHAFRIGVSANSLYGWGGMIGYHLELTIVERLTLDLDTGVIMHPIGHQRVFEKLKDRCGSHVRPSVTSELTNTIWLYTGVGMTLYLF